MKAVFISNFLKPCHQFSVYIFSGVNIIPSEIKSYLNVVKLICGINHVDLIYIYVWGGGRGKRNFVINMKFIKDVVPCM